MPRSRFITALVIGIGTALLVVFAVLRFAMPDTTGPSTRDVTLSVATPGPDHPVTLWEGGVRLLLGGDGRVRLGERPTPSHLFLEWTVGDGCDEGCPDRCPAWCELGSQRVEVPSGSGPYEATLAIAAPAARPVEVVANGPLGRAELGGRVGTREAERAHFEPILPGSYEMVLEIGACPPESLGCASSGDVCPEGCSSWSQNVAVPVGEGPVELVFTLPVPGAEPKPGPTAPKGAGAISGAAFARFVEANPDWGREAAIGAGRADARYLRDWSPDPPPGPVTQVTWGAARAYCESRGGLLGVDEAPLTWDRASGPTQEWRDSNGSPVWRRFDGVKSSRPERADRAFSFTGFRCRR
ncbi:MAG: hypothetical protein H6737_11660 [Alphaproteobacteria bacterium]|nr:hypothetical protein [Alphaproteobacteria bacterium]